MVVYKLNQWVHLNCFSTNLGFNVHYADDVGYMRTCRFNKMMVKILLIYLMSGCHKANGRYRSAKGTCPSDWNQWGDNCYKVIEQQPWSEARDGCVRIGGVMATPNSLEENTYIKSLESSIIWINCNDLETEGTSKLKQIVNLSLGPPKKSPVSGPKCITSDTRVCILKNCITAGSIGIMQHFVLNNFFCI